MSTKINVKRPGTGLVKLEVAHNGTAPIRSNLRSSLFGTTGESQRHIVEVRELAASVSHSCLTVPTVPHVFFRIFGRHANTQVRVAGAFNDVGHHLGERVHVPASQNNAGIVGITEAEFEMLVPHVYSIRDLLWIMQKKISRVNAILVANGWLSALGGLGADVDGVVDGGVGSLTYGVDAIILPTDPVPVPNIPDARTIELLFDASGNLYFDGSTAFWNSFGIWCSPYFQHLTGFPELVVRTLNIFGEAGSVQADAFVAPALNTTDAFITGTENLYTKFEERESILITSDIPLPPERTFPGDKLRYVFGHFDLKGVHNHTGGRTVTNGLITNSWYIQGTNVVGMQLMDSPKETGYASLVLPTILPSINVRALLRRKIWNFETNEHTVQEIPLLTSDIDQLILRMNFTLQM